VDIEVKVPATVANVGPGFDCVGVALGVYLRLRISASDKIEVVGSQAERGFEDNLTLNAFGRAYEAVGETPPPIKVEEIEVYPSARGMGASASAIVAGLVAAKEFGGLELHDSELAKLAVAIEGHADNVLPAMFGGLVVNAEGGWLRLEPSEGLAPVIVIAPKKFRTEESRKILPAEVPREDAIANASATAALVLTLRGAHPPEALMASTEDRLHEPYRLPLMPDTLDLHRSLRDEGIAAALAGSGPSVICIVESDQLDERVKAIRKIADESWEVISPGWDTFGAQVR
jgi:homoserine kinase